MKLNLPPIGELTVPVPEELLGRLPLVFAAALKHYCLAIQLIDHHVYIRLKKLKIT